MDLRDAPVPAEGDRIGDRLSGAGHERVGKFFTLSLHGIQGGIDRDGEMDVNRGGAIDAAVAPLMHQVVNPLLVGFQEDVADREQHVQGAAIADGAALAVAQLIQHGEAVQVEGNAVATGDGAHFGVGDPQVGSGGEFFEVLEVADVDLVGGQVLEQGRFGGGDGGLNFDPVDCSHQAVL
jgi:hypothetical protein